MLTRTSFRLAALFAIVFFNYSTTFASEIERTFNWEYAGKNYSMTYTLSASDYNYYKKLKKDYYNFSVYLNESENYPVVDKLAQTLKNKAIQNKLNEWQTVEFISAFVQNIPYVDDGKYEYPRYPIETLVDKGGDCEDTAILLAAILQSLGYSSILISPKGHMGTGIAVKENMPGTWFDYNDKRYYYIETTSKGWGIGDYPEQLSSQIIVFDNKDYAHNKVLSYNAPTDYSNSSTSSSSKKSSPAAASSFNKNTVVQVPSKRTVPEQNVPSYSSDKKTNTSSSYKEAVIDTDEIVIDGKRQSVSTQITSENGKQKVVMNEK